jgi:hypothetical protein
MHLALPPLPIHTPDTHIIECLNVHCTSVQTELSSLPLNLDYQKRNSVKGTVLIILLNVSMMKNDKLPEDDKRLVSFLHY